MKKIIIIIGLLLLTISSCSTDETDIPTKENSKPLLKTIEVINTTNGSTTVFTYNGYKIIQVTSNLYIGVYKIIYTYTGDYITKEDGYINDQLIVSTEYTYESNKLKTVIYKDTNSGTIFPAMNQNKLVYTYQPDNTVDIGIYSYSLNNWELVAPYPKMKIYFKDGNIVKREKFNTDGMISSTIIYEYDTKPNKYANIIGFDKLFFTGSFTNNFNRHFNIQDLNNVNNIIRNESDTYKYNYNSDGFPIEQINTYFSSPSRSPIGEKKYTYY
ncbi:hypothetical protein [uncultured Flavobacterium sp.]|uniref:hypothetical protein n=1 Tax=uncultured Flavobacterium sp. TaxID=165435 RepID=UPI0030EB12D6